jgi:hypothetical protein
LTPTQIERFCRFLQNSIKLHRVLSVQIEQHFDEIQFGIRRLPTLEIPEQPRIGFNFCSLLKSFADPTEWRNGCNSFCFDSIVLLKGSVLAETSFKICFRSVSAASSLTSSSSIWLRSPGTATSLLAAAYPYSLVKRIWSTKVDLFAFLNLSFVFFYFRLKLFQLSLKMRR